MERKQVVWIWEYVLKHSSNRRLMRYLMEAFPIPDDNIRLKKMVLLSSLSFEVSRGLCSDLCLKLLNGLAELTKKETLTNEVSEGIEAEGTGGSTSEGCLHDKEEDTSRDFGQLVKENDKQMLEISHGVVLDHRDKDECCKTRVESDKKTSKGKMSQMLLKDRLKTLGRELELALKVELTVQHLRNGAEGWPAFLEALDMYWDISEHVEEAADNEDKEISIARQQIKLELGAIKARRKLQSEVICSYQRDSLQKLLKKFLDLAWEEIGPTFLEKVEEDVINRAYKQAGGINLLQHTENPLYQEDGSTRKKVTQEKAWMEMGDVANARTVFQESPKHANHVEHSENTGQERFCELRGEPLRTISLIANKESSAVVEQGCNSSVDTQSLSRCPQRPPLKRLKSLATICNSNSITEGHGFDEGLTNSCEDGICFVRNEQHDAISRLDLVRKIGNVLKDGETLPASGKMRLLQQSEVMQRQELELGFQNTGSSDVQCLYINQGVTEADKGLKQPCIATPLETYNNQLKNAGESLNQDSPAVTGFDLLQRVDVAEARARNETNEQLPMDHCAEKTSELPSNDQIVDLQTRESCCLKPPPWTISGLQSKPVPGLMRGSIEKRRLYRKGIIDERVIVLALEQDPNEGTKALADPEILETQEALKDSQLNLRSLVKDPLPTAIHIANEAGEYIKKSVQSSPAPVNLCENEDLGEALQKSQPQEEGNDHVILKPEGIHLRKASLIDRKASARTVEWEDEDEIEDNEADNPPYTSIRVCFSELSSRRVTSLKQSSSRTHRTYRRKTRKWSESEENVLRAGVTRHGKGRWKFILQSNLDVFQDRTEVDLKDKWRNIERSEGILRDS